MVIFEMFKKKKKKDSELFKEADVDPDSDLPVHEEFVNEKGLREMKGKKKKRRV